MSVQAAAAGSNWRPAGGPGRSRAASALRASPGVANAVNTLATRATQAATTTNMKRIVDLITASYWNFRLLRNWANCGSTVATWSGVVKRVTTTALPLMMKM